MSGKFFFQKTTLHKLCAGFFAFSRMKFRNFISFNLLRWGNIFQQNAICVTVTVTNCSGCGITDSFCREIGVDL